MPGFHPKKELGFHWGVTYSPRLKIPGNSQQVRCQSSLSTDHVVTIRALGASPMLPLLRASVTLQFAECQSL